MPENEDVVGQNFQQHGAALTPECVGVKRVAESTLDHTEYCFNLPSLSVSRVVQMKEHPASIATRWRLRCRPADLRRDQHSNAELSSQQLVNPLGVVAGIRSQRCDPQLL